MSMDIGTEMIDTDTDTIKKFERREQKRALRVGPQGSFPL